MIWVYSKVYGTVQSVDDEEYAASWADYYYHSDIYFFADLTVQD
jgi:hypothetical protein